MTPFIKDVPFHLRCKKAADILAEEKDVQVLIHPLEMEGTMKAQIRVFLCVKYNFSANNSEAIIDKHLKLISNCV